MMLLLRKIVSKTMQRLPTSAHLWIGEKKVRRLILALFAKVKVFAIYNEGADDYCDHDTDTYEHEPVDSMHEDFANTDYDEPVAARDKWSQYYDDDNFPYWYDNETGESTYDNPYIT